MSFEAKLIEEEISVDDVCREIMSSTPESGALVIFIGYVKEFVEGHHVRSLKYDCYEPYTTQSLHKILEDEREEGISSIRIYHRIGELKPGDPAVYIFVSARNRVEAFRKARTILERVKNEAYIFKLERRDDGDYIVSEKGERIKAD